MLPEDDDDAFLAGTSASRSYALAARAPTIQHDARAAPWINVGAIVTIIVGAVSGLAVVTALTAMYIEASIAAYIAFIFPLFMAPYAIHQRRQINKLPTLMEEINKCRYKVSLLASENIALHANINRLTSQIQQLANIDDRLTATAQANNEDLASLRMLIYTNGNIQRQMAKCLQARDLQQLLTTLLACDTDQNSILSNTEVDQVLLRLEAFGSRIPKEVLRNALQKASLKQQQSTTSLYCSIMNMDPAREACGNYYVQVTD